MLWIPFLTSTSLAIAVFLICTSWQPIWDAVAKRYIADIAPSLQALSLEQSSIPVFLKVWGFTLVFSFLILFVVLQQIPMAFMVAYLVYMTPRWYLSWLIQKRRIMLRDQLVSAMQLLANATRAGLSLAQGLETVEKQLPDPMSSEIGGIVGSFHQGLPLSVAIGRAKERLQLESFSTFANVIQVSLERGGKVSQALDRISASLEEQQRLERKLESETASGRKTLLIMAIFPFVFVLAFLFLFPEGTMKLFTTMVGQGLLFVVCVLVFICVVWGNKIRRIT